MSFNAEQFAKWLSKTYSNSSYKSWEDVAKAVRKIGGSTTRASLSRYAGAKKQLLTDKASQPNPSICKYLAEVFDVDADKVLILGGHAPQNKTLVNNEKLAKIDFSYPDLQMKTKEQADLLIETLIKMIEGDEQEKGKP